MMQRLRSHFTSWEVLWNEAWNLFKYGIVGVSSMALNAGMYALLSRIVWTEGPRTLLSVIATAFAAVYNFALHRGWTFKTRAFNGAMVLRYVLVAVVGTALSGVVFYIGHELFGIYDFVVVLGTPFLVAGATYFLHRWYTFHPKHDA